MNHMFNIDDEGVRALLAPLDRVQPVLRRDRRQPRRRRVVFALAAGTSILVITGLAIASVFGPLHGAVLQPAPSKTPLPGTQLLACELIGIPAGEAAQLLNQNGIAIEWRYQHWGHEATTGAKGSPAAVEGGYSASPASVPANSVVWDVSIDPRADHTVFVFVQAPNDPNAPTIIRPDCSSGS